MADEQNKQGIIVRADFGGGIDQSMDAWRVPPSQLSDLVNARLDRVGSIRKRYGYQSATAPLSDAGLPIAAIGASLQTVVIDKARDNNIDDGVPGSSASDRILNECAYVARVESPKDANTWVTEGAVSDIITDVVTYDAGAGDYDEAWDIGATDDFVFIVRITRAKQTPRFSESNPGVGTTVTLTLSQYDATTRALIDSASTTLSGHVYPRLVLVPDVNMVILATAAPDRTSAGWPNVVAKSTIYLWYCQYSSSGLLSLTNFPPGGTLIQKNDWIEATAFKNTTAERYRPLVPFDIVADGTSLFAVGYASQYGSFWIQKYSIDAGVVTYSGQSLVNRISAYPPNVIVCELDPLGNVMAAATSVYVDPTLSPIFGANDGQIEILSINETTFAKNSGNVVTISRFNPLGLLTPGSLTLARTKQISVGVYQWSAFAEVMEWNGSNPQVYAHYLQEFAYNASTGDVIGTSYLSSATQTARPYVAAYAPKVSSSQRYPVRMPLGIGNSKSTWLGRDVVTNDLMTDYAANYSGNIGSTIITGPYQKITTACASPEATVVPRLLPSPPPHCYTSQGVQYVAHRLALDGTGGFAFAALQLTPRYSGDVLHAVYGDTPIAVGGMVQSVDGKQAAELAIVDRPYISAVVLNNAGIVNDFTSGDYLIQAVLAYRDAKGNIHRSAPSDPYRLNVSTTYRQWTIYHSLPDYLTRDDATLEFYVTAPNGTVLRKWFTKAVSHPFGTYSTAITDVFDSVLPTRANSIGLPDLDAPTLYTSAGTLPFVPVPSSRFAIMFRNRLVVGGADDKRTVYYSNTPVANESTSFAVGNVIRLDHDNGCHAAGTLNDKLVLFTESAVYLVFGQFRDDTGAGDAVSPPENLHNFIGCVQPSSVWANPSGLMFFGTDNRFYLLTPELDLKPVGLAVQSWTAEQGFNVVQAVVDIPQEREVRFYMTNGNSNTICLVYNHLLNQWSRDAITNPATGATCLAWGGACYSNRLGVLVASPQGWMTDNRSSWKDGAYYVPMSASTAWIQPGGSQDYARLRFAQVLGRSMANHLLTVRVFTDFDESTVRSTGTWTDAQLAPIGSYAWPEQVKLQVATQKTQAVKIQIYDAAPLGATSGRGPQLIGLALDVLPLGGVQRLPNARKQ